MSNKKTIPERVARIIKKNPSNMLEVGQIIWGKGFKKNQKEYLKTTFHKLEEQGTITLMEPDMKRLFEEYGYKEEDLERKKTINFYTVFLSYSTLDSNRFQIKNLAKILKNYPEIKDALFWETNSGSNIVEYMEKTLKKCNVFVLFCSKNSLNSEAGNDEWQAAFQLKKKGSLKIIPVYEDEKYIPALLTPLLNVRFLENNFIDLALGLRKEILRE